VIWSVLGGRYTYIPIGIKREMVRSGVDCHWKGQVVGTVERGPVAIHSSGQTISSLAHIEGIILGAGEEVDEEEQPSIPLATPW
jgi:hypothetical protein